MAKRRLLRLCKKLEHRCQSCMRRRAMAQCERALIMIRGAIVAARVARRELCPSSEYRPELESVTCGPTVRSCSALRRPLLVALIVLRLKGPALPLHRSSRTSYYPACIPLSQWGHTIQVNYPRVICTATASLRSLDYPTSLTRT